MKMHITVVTKWLNTPASVPPEELQATACATYAAMVGTDYPSQDAIRLNAAACSANAGNSADAAYWANVYLEGLS